MNTHKIWTQICISQCFGLVKFILFYIWKQRLLTSQVCVAVHYEIICQKNILITPDSADGQNQWGFDPNLCHRHNMYRSEWDVPVMTMHPHPTPPDHASEKEGCCLECQGKSISHALVPGSHPLAPSARRHEQLGSLAQGLWTISTETNERQ